MTGWIFLGFYLAGCILGWLTAVDALLTANQIGIKVTTHLDAVTLLWTKDPRKNQK
jgi:hypothetical protein